MLRPRLSWVAASSGFGFAFHFAHRAIEHLGIQFEPDGFDVSALFSAQQIAGAAQFKIQSGDLEAGAQDRRILSELPDAGARSE